MSEPASATPREQVAQAMSSLWWLPLLRGIMLFALGVYALIQPRITIAVLAQVIGIFVVVDGVFSVVAGVIGGVPSRGWVIFRGVIEILVGLFVFANPVLVAGLTTAFLVYMLAFSSIVTGVFEIIAAIQDRKHIEGEGWLILSGAISILFGIVIFLAPLNFGLFMVRVLGVFAILGAISLIAFAFRLKGLGKKLAS